MDRSMELLRWEDSWELPSDLNIRMVRLKWMFSCLQMCQLLQPLQTSSHSSITITAVTQVLRIRIECLFIWALATDALETNRLEDLSRTKLYKKLLQRTIWLGNTTMKVMLKTGSCTFNISTKTLTLKSSLKWKNSTTTQLLENSPITRLLILLSRFTQNLIILNRMVWWMISTLITALEKEKD